MTAPTSPPTGLAPWGARVRAYLFDLIWIVPGLCFYLAGLYTVRNQVAQPAMRLLLLQVGLSLIFFGWGYTRWFLGRLGATWGKQRVGLLLVGAQEQPVTLLTVVLRDFAHLLDALPLGLGFLWPLWDAEKCTFADRLLRTRVVRN